MGLFSKKKKGLKKLKGLEPKSKEELEAERLLSQNRAPQVKQTSQLKAPKKKFMTLKEAPSAKDAAFGGPPRYDWIDVETAAAIKVQSKFRQMMVVKQLEEQGLTTAGMRNRRRHQQYLAQQRQQRDNAASKPPSASSEDTPFFLTMCGIGSLFGYHDDEDAEEKEQNKNRQLTEQQMRDAKIREFHANQKKRKDNVIESVEVVEDM